MAIRAFSKSFFPHFIIILAFFADINLAKIDYWENYKDLSFFDWYNRLAENREEMENSSAFRCYAFQQIEENLSMFGKKIEEEKNSKLGFLNVIWDMISVYSSLYDLKDHQLLIRNSLLRETKWIQNLTEASKDKILSDSSLDKSTLNMSEALMFSESNMDFISKLENAKIEELEDRVLDIKISYAGLGKIMADLLFRNQFVCFSIPQLSLFIFKLFYYNIINKKYLLRFFKGFYEGLLAPQQDERKTKVREALMRRFYGFNLKIFLRFDSDFAANIIKLFVNSDKAKEREDLVDNFANLYNFLIKSVRGFEVKQKRKLKEYVEKFLKGDRKTILKCGKRASLLLSIYTLNYLKGLAMSTAFPGPLSVVVDHHISDTWKQITNSLDTFLGDSPKEEVVEYFKHNIENKEVNIPLNDIEDFAIKFEEKVNTCSKCDMCQTNALFNDFFLFDKQERSELKEKMILI